MKLRKVSKPHVITICSSAAFYPTVIEVEKKLKKLGFKVKIPVTARIMQKNNNFDVSFYKTWYSDPKAYKKKKELMDRHFSKVLEADSVLVINENKHGMEGYIGGNVLMEMTLAYHKNKPIYIYNNISENLSIKEEVYGLFPVFIEQNLSLIKQ